MAVPYTSFAIITDTPGRLATFLESRGIIKQMPDGTYEGVLPGMEWIKVPNPIMTDPGSGGDPTAPGYIPPTRDTRHVFLVKFAHDSLGEKEGPFRTWLMNNTTPVSSPAGWTVYGEPAGDARKVNGQNVWLVHDNPERFGTWL